eukprot:GILK01019131.1.p1 GENE.GILK01019131.1~~GILK01019131.1.p1  ORF type:complete len:517 (+),score=15.34 GILK01019131.1:121-1551(+)
MAPAASDTAVMTNGTAWFRSIVFNTSAANTRPVLTFQAVAEEATVPQYSTYGTSLKDGTIRANRKSIQSGNIIFVPPTELTRLVLAPYFAESGTQIRVPEPTTELTADRAGVTVSVFEDDGQMSALEVSLYAINAANRRSLPLRDGLVEATCSSNEIVGGNNATFQIDQRPSLQPTSVLATFSQFQFSETQFITGYFSTLTFTANENPNRPLRVGPLIFEGSSATSVVEEPIVLVEVLQSGASFSIDTWVGNLAGMMNIPKARIEVIKVRQGGSASEAFDRSWSGTRIELRFLSPKTSTTLKIPSTELTEYFLTLSSNDCGVVSPLRIRRKLLLSDDTDCDLFVLDEQRRAAQRCVETNGPADRCLCHEPMFVSMGSQCKLTEQMLSTCATLNRCGDYTAISDPCFELTYLIYLQYFFVGLCTFVFLLTVYIVYLWRTGAFQRWRRRRMADALDAKAPPMIAEADDMRYEHMELLV